MSNHGPITLYKPASEIVEVINNIIPFSKEAWSEACILVANFTNMPIDYFCERLRIIVAQILGVRAIASHSEFKENCCLTVVFVPDVTNPKMILHSLKEASFSGEVNVANSN